MAEDGNWKVVVDGVTRVWVFHDQDTAECLAEQIWNQKGGHIQVLSPAGHIITEFET